MNPEREWWLRLLAVITRPRAVFVALRVDDPEDLDARQEPILLVTLLAGIAGVLLTSTWATLLDGQKVDGLVLAVVTFVGGSFYGAAAYAIGGAALYAGTRALGSLGSWRLARQVLAFACTPLALSVPLTVPVGLAAFGGDLFRAGGSDAGTGGDVYLAYRLAFAGWSLALLVYGVRTTYAWTWARALGALALIVVFVGLLAGLGLL